MSFHSSWTRKCLFLTSMCSLGAMQLSAATKRPLSPEACTAVNYLAEDELTNRPSLEMSPTGKDIAYVVQVPDIAANTNHEELFVTSLSDHSAGTPRAILVNELIAAVQWFPDGRHLAALVRRGSKVVLIQVDSATTLQDVIWEAANDITDYSMDAIGKTIAVVVKVQPNMLAATDTLKDERRGYRIDLVSIAHPVYPRRQLYILHRADDHHWKLSRRIKFKSPLSGRTIEDIVDNHAMHISVSPNGQFVLIDNIEDFSAVPSDSIWAMDYGVRYEKNRGSVGLLVSYLYDLTTNEVSMPLKSPYVMDGSWSPDSKSYMKVALAPVDSKWERSDFERGTPSIHITHLFSVDVKTGTIVEVLNRAEAPPIAWTTRGDIIVRASNGTLSMLQNKSNSWEQTESIQIPLANAAPYSPLTSDGKRAVLEYEDASTAPQLIAFDWESNRVWTVARLDPQMDQYALPETRQITWTTSTGFQATGLLLLPPDYDSRRRYPLVIENGSILYSGEFVCDSGITHVPSFARGILADAGVVYLMRYWPGINNWESAYYPKGMPGYLAEAAFKQDLAESAVRLLDERRIIDPKKVGLVGFSRGGWYVEYMLTHSKVAFQAASATDNVMYSLGEYWYLNNEKMARTQEGMYGGPPYGATLKNWLRYSISFNLDQIHTPLLMEVMGYGKGYGDVSQPPDNLAVHNEIYVGLTRLHKPVEYYYYPNEQHQPDHPQARIASLQRNVDWFRFWLQGYERTNPEDPNQYKRWEDLREEQSVERSEKLSTSADAHSHQ